MPAGISIFPPLALRDDLEVSWVGIWRGISSVASIGAPSVPKLSTALQVSWPQPLP